MKLPENKSVIFLPVHIFLEQ